MCDVHRHAHVRAFLASTRERRRRAIFSRVLLGDSRESALGPTVALGPDMQTHRIGLGVLLLAGLSGCSAPPGESTGENEDELRVCSTGSTIKGVDVSHYEGSVNWKSASAAGIKFGFAKATEGTGTKDDTFAADWAGMKAAGIIRGAYHFFHPGESASAQASFVVKTVGTLGANDFPIVLDSRDDRRALRVGRPIPPRSRSSRTSRSSPAGRRFSTRAPGSSRAGVASPRTRCGSRTME